MTQTDQIKYHLENIGPITPLEALEKYGCFRLGARIFDLKEQGVDVRSRSKSNGKKKFAEYYLQRAQ